MFVDVENSKPLNMVQKEEQLNNKNILVRSQGEFFDISLHGKSQNDHIVKFSRLLPH